MYIYFAQWVELQIRFFLEMIYMYVHVSILVGAKQEPVEYLVPKVPFFHIAK